MRWLAVTSSGGAGAMFVNPDLMSVSVGDYRPEEQYVDRGNRAWHPYQIKKAGKTIVNLDAFNRPLGNASCGPDVLEKYELRAADTDFRFMICPLTTSSGPESLAARYRSVTSR